MPPPILDPVPGPVHAPPSYGFPRSAEGLMPWTEAVEALERARTYWLGTASPGGRPYLTPLWGVWVDGAVYFDGAPTTRWARNFAVRPRITIGLEVDGRAVILDGAVEDLETDADLGARIVDAWQTKYGTGAPEPVQQGLFRLRPATARAWSELLVDGTRWTFAAEAAQ